uniref:Transcriptional regulator n=1 Tax=Globodera pallida TaxID=36090 RepID=A0A183CLZ6_GLOPA
MNLTSDAIERPSASQVSVFQASFELDHLLLSALQASILDYLLPLASVRESAHLLQVSAFVVLGLNRFR